MRGAPAWLTDLLRPKAVEATRSLYAEYVGRDGHAYALAAVRGELAHMSAAVPGTRNQAAYRVAARLIELCLADWSHLDYAEVQSAYLGACELANTDGEFLDGEAWGVWFSAERRIRDPATLPAPEHLGTVMPWIDVAGAGGVSDFDQAAVPAAQRVAAMLTADPYERDVAFEMHRLRVRQEATRRLATLSERLTDFDQEVLDDEGLAALPRPDALVDGYLDRDSLARVNGPSGHGKSFVTLDLAACVASGRNWHGRAVTQAAVLYLAAEGVQDMGDRAAAWAQRHDVDSTGVVFLPRAVQVGGAEWPALCAWVARRGFGLIVVDTQARATVGVKENDATEMGEIVAGLDLLRGATGACVLLVHHRGLTGEHGRGSTAIKGAMDAELDVSRSGATITVKTTKQKRRAEALPMLLTMQPLGASIVLVGERDQVDDSSPFTSPVMTLSLRDKCAIAIAHALIDAKGSGLTRSEAQAHARVALDLASNESNKRVVRRAWADLVGIGRIARAQGREAYFFLEMDGLPILSVNPDKVVEGGPELYMP